MSNTPDYIRKKAKALAENASNLLNKRHWKPGRIETTIRILTPLFTSALEASYNESREEIDKLESRIKELREGFERYSCDHKDIHCGLLTTSEHKKDCRKCTALQRDTEKEQG